MPEELVLTPGGYRPKSMVHYIEPSHILDHAPDGTLRKLDSSGKLLAELAVIKAKPAGVGLMPNNIAHAEATPAPSVSGVTDNWKTYAYWTNNTGTPISSFRTTWVVPPAPYTQSQQAIYLYHCIQNSTNTKIYASLLWAVTDWEVMSWCLDGQTWSHSGRVLVAVGTTLIGVIELTGQSGSGYNYSCYFEGLANTRLSINNVEQLTVCSEELSVAGITQGADYPATDLTAMTAIEVKVGNRQAPLNWTPVNPIGHGQHCIVVSNASPGGEVDLYYAPRIVSSSNGIVWSSNDIGPPWAVAWEIGDVNGDGRAEVVQLQNNGGKLEMIVYGWSRQALMRLWSADDIGQGGGAIAWEIGDVNGDGQAEIVQLWDYHGKLGMIVYGWSGNAMTALWSTGDIGQGSGAVAWQIGDVNGDGRAEIVQLWDCHGKLRMIVYGWSSGMTALWATGDMGEGSGAVAWQIGDVNGDGRAEIVQLWDYHGKLGMIVYGWSSSMTALWSTGDIGQGSGAVAWQIGDVNGDGRAEIVQLWDNHGKLGMIVYGWSSGMTALWSTGDIGQGSGAVAWEIGDVNGDGRAEIVQLWDNGGKLGMIVYGWHSGMTTLWSTGDMGQGSGAIAWLSGKVTDRATAEIVQLIKNDYKLGVVLYSPPSS
jgi:hypothetical protein